MVDYATSANFTDRYGSNFLIDLADRDDDDTADTTAVSLAISDVSSEIDTFLGRQYPLPLASVPDWLIRCCCDLVAYHLASENAGAINSTIEKKVARWYERLQLIADGKAGLGLGSDEPASHFDDAFNSDDPVMLPTQTDTLF